MCRRRAYSVCLCEMCLSTTLCLFKSSAKVMLTMDWMKTHAAISWLCCLYLLAASVDANVRGVRVVTTRKLHRRRCWSTISSVPCVYDLTHRWVVWARDSCRWPLMRYQNQPISWWQWNWRAVVHVDWQLCAFSDRRGMTSNTVAWPTTSTNVVSAVRIHLVGLRRILRLGVRPISARCSVKITWKIWQRLRFHIIWKICIQFALELTPDQY